MISTSNELGGFEEVGYQVSTSKRREEPDGVHVKRVVVLEAHIHDASVGVGVGIQVGGNADAESSSKRVSCVGLPLSIRARIYTLTRWLSQTWAMCG